MVSLVKLSVKGNDTASLFSSGTSPLVPADYLLFSSAVMQYAVPALKHMMTFSPSFYFANLTLPPPLYRSLSFSYGVCAHFILAITPLLQAKLIHFTNDTGFLGPFP